MRRMRFANGGGKAGLSGCETVWLLPRRRTAWHCLALPGIAWNCLELPGTAWNCLKLPGTARDCLELPG